MKKLLIRLTLSALLFLTSSCHTNHDLPEVAADKTAEQQHKLIKSDGDETSDEPQKVEHMWGAAWRDEPYIPTQAKGAQWFKDAGMGLFLHWSISTKSPKPNTEISWSMIKNLPWDPNEKGTLTPNEYFALAETFDPVNYDPEKWIEAAAKAGFTYAVLTTKHHDGYALWPSDYGQFSTKQYLNGRDLVRPFIEACRKYGLKAGLYFSPPDMHFNKDYISFNWETTWGTSPPDSPKRRPLGLNHEPIERRVIPKDWPEKYRQFTGNQVRELLTRYGPIDILWFDGGPEGISMDEIRKLQPNILVNPRMHGFGDFETFECRYPDHEPTSPWWELCMSMKTFGWAYMNNETYLDTTSILEWLVKTRSMGGNLLANVGPGPDGTLPDVVYDRFGEIEQWMEIHRESVFQVEPGYWSDISNYPVTVGTGKWYIHLIPSINDPVTLKTEKTPEDIILMRSGEKVSFSRDRENLVLNLDPEMRGHSVDVLKVIW